MDHVRYINILTPRLPGQTSIFAVVSFVSKSLLGIEGQKKLEKFAILTESLGAVLEYWYIERGLLKLNHNTMINMPPPA